MFPPIAPNVLEWFHLHWGEHKKVWNDPISHRLQKPISLDKNTQLASALDHDTGCDLETVDQKESTKSGGGEVSKFKVLIIFFLYNIYVQHLMFGGWIFNKLC